MNAPDTAPWWGVPLLAGTFAFVGVLLAQASALWLERVRRRREDSRRWDQERRRAYAAFLGEVGRIHRETVLRDEAAEVPQLIEVMGSLETAYDEVLLLGTEDVRNAASEVFQRIAVVVDQGPGTRGFKREDGAFTVALNGFSAAREHLTDSFRDELGIVMTPPRRFVIEADGVLRVFAQAFSLILTSFGEAVTAMFGVRVSRRRGGG